MWHRGEMKAREGGEDAERKGQWLVCLYQSNLEKENTAAVKELMHGP